MRKLGLAAASAVALLALAPRALAAEPPKIAPPPEPEWARAIKQKLERKVSFEFNGTPLTEAVAFFQTLTKSNMIIDPDAEEAKGTTAITLKVTNESLGVALRRVLAMAGLDYGLLNRTVFISTPERLAAAWQRNAEARREAARLPDGVWEIEVKRKLARKVTFEFVETPLTEGLQFLQTLTETTIIVDPIDLEDRDNTPITLNVTKMPLGVALRWILRLADLDYGLVDGAMFVSTRKRIISTRRALHARRFADALRPETAWASEIRQKLARSVSFEFSETPFSETVAFLQTLTKINIILDPLAEASDIPVTLKVTNMPIDAAFRWMCLNAGSDYALVDRAIFISTPERSAMELLRSAERKAADAALQNTIPEWERVIRRKLARKVTFEFVDTPLDDAIQFLRTLMETPFDMRTGASSTPVTLDVADMPLSDALRWICRLAELNYSLADGKIRIGPAKGAAWRRKMSNRLSRKLYYVFEQVTAGDVVTLIGKQTRLNLISDAAGRDGMRKQIELDLKNVPFADALEHILERCELAHAVIDEAVFVSTPEHITEVARLEAARLERKAARTGPVEWWEPGLTRTLDGRVTLNIDDKPFGKALSVLARASGLTISVDPKLAKSFVLSRVTLGVHDMHAGAALRWLCRLAGADYRLTEGGVSVSTSAAFRQREIDAALAKRVTLDFGDAEMQLASWIHCLEPLTGVRLVVDAALQPENNDRPGLRCVFKDVPARKILDNLTRRTNTEWTVRDGAVFVSTPAVISGKPERKAAPRRKAPALPAETPPTYEDDVF